MITDPIENLRASIAYSRETYGISDAAMEYRRRREPDKVSEPTEADWAAYRAALAAIDKLEDNPHIYVGAIEIDEPDARREPGDYIETEREWIRRVAKLIAESGGHLPEDLDRALSVGELRLLNAVLGPRRSEQ